MKRSIFSLALSFFFIPICFAKVGTLFASPVVFEKSTYFVTLTGTLYESDTTFDKVKILHPGKEDSLGLLTLAGKKLYWGEGRHDQASSHVMIYDIQEKKLLKRMPIKGHMEGPPLFHEGLVYLPLGPEGIMALDNVTLNPLWQMRTHQGKPLHIDSNILSIEDKICATTIGQTKGVICFEAKSGSVTQFSELTRDPKSEISLWKKHVVGIATEGDIGKPDWDLPADLFVYDVKNDKMKMSKELRGFSFFAPLILQDQAFLTLSTGDFILLNLTDGKIHLLGEASGPFSNNGFLYKEKFCGISILGKLLCYEREKDRFRKVLDKKVADSVIGKSSVLAGKLVVPTKDGYYVE